MKNIYAHTGPTPKVGYVGYISINKRDNGIEVSVRSEGEAAPVGVITLSPEQCEHLATDLLAHINQEPPAKPEQQAQAGEPEVVAWLNTKWGFVEKDAEVRKALRNVNRIEESPAFLAGDLHALIKLQAYRDATSHLEAGYRFWFRIAKESGEAITKKDAALKACVTALKKYTSPGQFGGRVPIEHAAITQAQEALK